VIKKYPLLLHFPPPPQKLEMIIVFFIKEKLWEIYINALLVKPNIVWNALKRQKKKGENVLNVNS